MHQLKIIEYTIPVKCDLCTNERNRLATITIDDIVTDPWGICSQCLMNAAQAMQIQESIAKAADDECRCYTDVEYEDNYLNGIMKK